MLVSKKHRPHLNQKGMAIFEMIPILLVLILLLNFSLGFFGAIHTGIKNSVAARNYAFETYRHRASLTYFSPLNNDSIHYDKAKVRIHGIVSEKKSDALTWYATSRPIDHFDFQPQRDVDLGTSSAKDHVEKVQDLDDSIRNESLSVNPIWIKTTYGMCLNARCKP
ncbi:MAG: hypothetical protein ACLGGX_00410 [Bdellovibrionia bacterium]